jgi:hypothetical protein
MTKTKSLECSSVTFRLHAGDIFEKQDEQKKNPSLTYVKLFRPYRVLTLT